MGIGLELILIKIHTFCTNSPVLMKTKSQAIERKSYLIEHGKNISEKNLGYFKNERTKMDFNS